MDQVTLEIGDEVSIKNEYNNGVILRLYPNKSSLSEIIVFPDELLRVLDIQEKYALILRKDLKFGWIELEKLKTTQTRLKSEKLNLFSDEISSHTIGEHSTTYSFNTFFF